MSRKKIVDKNIFSDRLSRLIIHLGYKNRQQSKFAEDIGVPQSTVSEIINSKKDPTLPFLFGIANKWPQININWLLTGNGNMVIPQDSDNEIDISHINIVRQFINKDDAYEINFKLAEIEKENLIEFGHIKGVVSEVHRKVFTEGMTIKKRG